MIAAQTLDALSSIYKHLLESSERGTARTAYVSQLKSLKATLVAARSEVVTTSAVSAAHHASDTPPNFAPLVSDPKMQAILTRRWAECVSCIGAKAPLAATVMMGGLLEAVLLARIHKEPNRQTVFHSAAAPIDVLTKKPKQLSDWGLRDFIDVAHELKWITVSAKSVGEVLRDYRNYIHPYKELSHGVVLQPDDAVLLWELSKSISRQVIKSAP